MLHFRIKNCYVMVSTEYAYITIQGCIVVWALGRGLTRHQVGQSLCVSLLMCWGTDQDVCLHWDCFVETFCVSGCRFWCSFKKFWEGHVPTFKTGNAHKGILGHIHEFQLHFEESPCCKKKLVQEKGRAYS